MPVSWGKDRVLCQQSMTGCPCRSVRRLSGRCLHTQNHSNIICDILATLPMTQVSRPSWVNEHSVVCPHNGILLFKGKEILSLVTIKQGVVEKNLVISNVLQHFIVLNKTLKCKVKILLRSKTNFVQSFSIWEDQCFTEPYERALEVNNHGVSNKVMVINPSF